MRWRRDTTDWWDERFRVARELRKLVLAAWDYGLPLPFEPTQIVNGKVVHPLIESGLYWNGHEWRMPG